MANNNGKDGSAKEENSVGMLLIGKSSIGTTYYPEGVFDAIAAIVENKKIDGIVMNDPLAHHPTKYGKANARIWRSLKEGINSPENVKDVAARELEKFNAAVSRVPVHVLYTDDSYKNVDVIVERRIAEESKKRIEELRVTLAEKIEANKEEFKTLEKKHAVVQKRLEKALKEVEKQEGMEIYSTFPFTQSSVTEQRDLLKKIGKIDEESADEIKGLMKERESILTNIRRAENGIAAMEVEKKNYAVTRFTKQFSFTRDEFIAIDRRARIEYKELVLKALPVGTIHAEAEKDIEIGGVKLNVAYSRNLKSDAPLEGGIRRQVNEAFARNIGGESLPDLFIEFNGKGGLKVFPQEKQRVTADNRPRQIPEMISFVQAPTIHDQKLLRKARQNKIKNPDTDRMTGPYASGISIYTVREDGTHEIEFFSTDELRRINEVEAQVSELSKKLGGTEKEGRKEIKAKIKELRRSIYNPDDVKIVAFSDTHIGAPNEPGSITNYEYIDAAIKRERAQERPADIIVMCGDMIHGSMFKGSDNEYLGMSDYEVKEKEGKIRNDSSLLSPAEKIEEIVKLNDEARRAIPITSVDKQKREFKERFVTYVEEVFEKNPEAKLILVGGNHFGKSMGGKEHEELELKNLFSRKYWDRIITFGGTHTGSGQALVNGISIYAMHQPKRYSDEVTGMENAVHKSNIDADVAFGGDHHHGGVGYIGKTFVIPLWGMQPHTKYVDWINKTPGRRGYATCRWVNKDRASVEMDLDNTLAPYMENVKAVG